MIIVNAMDDLSAIIRIIERIPVLILISGFIIVGMLLRD